MQEFIELLKNWNHGIIKGAQARLARELDVSKVTVLKWTKGELNPSEIQIVKMAKVFKKEKTYLENIFCGKNNSMGNINSNNKISGSNNQIINNSIDIELLKKDIELLKKETENLRLKIELISKK